MPSKGFGVKFVRVMPSGEPEREPEGGEHGECGSWDGVRTMMGCWWWLVYVLWWWTWLWWQWRCGSGVRERYWSGAPVGAIGPRPNLAEGRVSKETQRDVVSEALQVEGVAGSRGERETWERDEMHGARVGLKPMQVTGETGPAAEFSFHDAFCGMGGGSLGFGQAGGVCAGAFDSDPHAQAAYEKATGRRPAGKLAEVSAASLGAAEVFLSGCPCQDFLIRGQRHGKSGDRGKLMWEQLRLVREASAAGQGYKMVVFEQVPNFRKMNNGREFREFSEQLRRLGYRVWCKVLFAPDFGSVSARRRLWIVAAKEDVAAVVGDFAFPEPATEHYPLRTVLEPAAIRDRSVWVRQQRLSLLRKPLQRNSHSLTQVGFLDGGGVGRRVYSADGFAATQKASGQGPGWTSGVYLVDGRVSRLSVREVARVQQFEDSVELPAQEEVARRLLGNAMPVGMARAIGAEVGRYLEAAREGVGAGAERGNRDFSEKESLLYFL